MANNSIKYPNLLICIIITSLFWIIPNPEGLSITGWRLLGLFITTIVAIITKPMPMGAITLIIATTTIIFNIIPAQKVFLGFSNQIAWLVLIAFFLAKGFKVTGLGQRLALQFTKMLGKNTLGLSYGLAISDLLLAPAIPSVTARVGGIIYPVLTSIATAYKSLPNCKSAEKMGGFLIFTAFQITVLTSAMFMTAMAANPVLVNLSADQGIIISWGDWALASIVPGLISIITIPFVIYKLFPPTIKHIPQAPILAKTKLLSMGKMKMDEYIMLGVLFLLVILWSCGAIFKISATTAAMFGLSILLLTGILNWQELIEESKAWETFFWFSILIMLAKNLGEYGVVTWANSHMLFLKDINWWIAFPIITAIYFYIHYFFASSVAHVTSMFPAALSLAIMAGAPPKLATYTLMFFSSLYGGITHYSLAPAPMLFEAGYVDIKTWWKLGFICSIVNIIIWSTIGSIWWKWLGIW